MPPLRAELSVGTIRSLSESQPLKVLAGSGMDIYAGPGGRAHTCAAGPATEQMLVAAPLPSACAQE